MDEKLFAMMTSADYKERFKAEYIELKTRIEKLSAMLKKWRDGALEFTPSCSYELLHKQLVFMEEYLDVLEERAKIENVEV